MEQLQQFGDPGTLLRTVFSPAVLIWGVLGSIVSIIGWIAYRRGRKSHKRVLVIGGIALMVYPYVVYDPLAMIALGAVICLGMAVFRDAL